MSHLQDQYASFRLWLRGLVETSQTFKQNYFLQDQYASFRLWLRGMVETSQLQAGVLCLYR